MDSYYLGHCLYLYIVCVTLSLIYSVTCPQYTNISWRQWCVLMWYHGRAEQKTLLNSLDLIYGIFSSLNSMSSIEHITSGPVIIEQT